MEVIRDYISRHHTSVAHYIATQKIFELAFAEVIWPVSLATMHWWYHWSIWYGNKGTDELEEGEWN